MKYLTLTFIAIFSLTLISENSFGQQSFQESKTLMGKKLSVTQTSGPVSSGDGVTSTTNVEFAGKSIPLLNSTLSFNPSSTITSLESLIGNSNHDYYVNGVKVFSDSVTNSNGTVTFSGTVPPNQMAIPVFSYTVGPLVLAVNAGLSYEAAITGKLTPTLSPTVTDSSVSASLDASATASGFVEGLARVLVVQAGIGGSVNILAGDTSVAAQVFFQGDAPKLTYNGKLSVLGGKIYAFVDTKILFSDWKRLKSFNLYQWPGKCWAMGASSCTSN